MDSLTTETYENIYNGLLEAEAWIRSLGLPTRKNRFDEILANVEIVRNHYNKPTIKTVLGDRSVAELWVSLLDAGDFINIYKQFRNLKDNQLPRRRLRDTLSGPLLPWDEDIEGNTIHARSALFELELAARFQAQGLRLSGFDDIRLELCGVNINVQCKRPHSISRLQENIQNASSQISKRIGDTPDRGLIALRIDRLLGIDTKIQKVPDEYSLKMFEYRMDQFLKIHKDKFKHILDIPILGIFVDLPFIAEVKNRNNLVVRGYESILFQLCSDNADVRLLEKLAEKVTVPPNQ